MDPAPTLTPGRTATVHLTVAERDTALAFASGTVPVLATPRVLALAEEACVVALGDAVPGDSTTVGTWAEVEHLAATPIGRTVTAAASLDAVDGRRLEFSVVVSDDEQVVARVGHRRAVVSLARFGTPRP